MRYQSFDFAGTACHCGVLLSRGSKGDESHLRRADLEMVQKGRVRGRQVDREDCHIKLHGDGFQSMRTEGRGGVNKPGRGHLAGGRSRTCIPTPCALSLHFAI